MKHEFDVIVVGGGHAGTEAALASARAGADTLLLTHNIGTVGELSCNPAIGGIGKGHLVKEIDAMGGAMAKAADRAGIQFRTLNASKGSAVRATRCQADRLLYKQAIHEIVSEQSQLQLFMEAVDDLLLEGDRVVGVLTESGLTFSAKTVVLTTGTFLNGKIHVGMESHAAGRVAEKPSLKLAQRLRDLPFRVERLKTGTPPRIDARSIDFSKLAEQPGDEPRPVFSFMGSHADHPKQVPCHITYTNETTHDIIRNSLDRSPLYAGIIDGIGPRYCPSIEDKIVRFADKQRHQIFLEPEGLSSSEIYPNGISTSLPFDVQVALLHSMDGLENAWITRAGYAIEYDFFDPRDLRMSLESKLIEGLYMAGQINGTTGYEEAGAQGLLAGANAALAAQQKSPIILERSQAYMGVLVDDLIKDGTKEPYRMFTSRAEHRLLLREDNADQRLTELAHQYQLVDETRWRAFNTKMDAVADEKQRLQGLSLKQSDLPAGFNDTYSIKPLSRAYKASELMTRPELGYDALMQVEKCAPAVGDPQVAEQVEIQFKYQGYIERQQLAITKQENQQHKALPLDLDYTQVKGLSNEVRQKLKEVRPESIAQAGRISGVTPAAIAILLVHMKKHSAQQSLK